MAFADKYILKKAITSYSVKKNPNNNLKIIIVIPCYNEDKIIDTILSVKNNNYNDNLYEIIIVINHSINDKIQIKNNNIKTLEQLNNNIKKNNWNNIFCIKAFDLPPKKSGVGFARKIGMDLAIKRFNDINNNKGIIVSLDADTLVKQNYLSEIDKLFSKNNIEGVSIYFEHQLNNKHINTKQDNAILLYELHLRYFVLSLKFIGYQNVFHTVGSAFAITSLTYAKYGGMVTKKAGEDFYFINKIASNGKFKYLTKTTVYPSSRESDRVPFGTGPEVTKIIKNDSLLTYDFNSFLDLKDFINNFNWFYKISEQDYKNICKNLPENLVDFLNQNNFFDNITKISTNSTNIHTFKKAFFKWFSVFRVIKFLNLSHTVKYQKKDIISQVKIYLQFTNNHNNITDNYKLLQLMRFIDYNNA